MDFRLKKRILPLSTLFIVVVLHYLLFFRFAWGISEQREKGALFNFTKDTPTIPPIPWAFPYSLGKIKILGIAPYFSFLDFLELEKRLECELVFIPTEDSFHLGCDPNWGNWCKEEAQTDTVLSKLKSAVINNWDILIIAGINLDILSKEIYELILAQIKEGKGLILIPSVIGEEPYTKNLVDLIEIIKSYEEPTDQWKKIISAEKEDLTTKVNKIQPKCITYQKGRIVLLKGYIGSAETHVLVPEFIARENIEFLENSWAAFIQLILWCTRKEPNIIVKKIVDAKPKGPEEEDIPPELSLANIRDDSQLLLGPGTYPFLLEIQNKGKEKSVDLKIQIRREGYPWHYQQYEFKETLKKNRNSFVQFEIPLGSGKFFIDVWVTSKKKIISYYSKHFSIISWPKIEYVKSEKNYVLPNDSIPLQIKISEPFQAKNEATIVIQTYDLNISEVFPMGKLISEQAQVISGKNQELKMIVNVADIQGNYIKVNAWGVPFKVQSLGNRESPLFSFYTLTIPVRRKNVDSRMTNLVIPNNIQEPNQLMMSYSWEKQMCAGIYLDSEYFTSLKNHEFITHPTCVQFVKGVTPLSVSEYIRTPCINDHKNVENIYNSISKILSSQNIFSPNLISIGLNNCLTLTEEPVCFCNNCLNLFKDYCKVSDIHYELNQSIEKIDLEDIKRYLIHKACNGIPSILLAQYQKFMTECFIQHLSNIKNKIKIEFMEIPIGQRFFSGKESLRGIDWLGAWYSFDWLCIDPDPYLFALLRSGENINKSRLYALFDFAEPKQTQYEILWKYWLSIFNQSNGIWWKNPYGTIHSSIPIKMVTPEGMISPQLKELYDTIKIANSGLAEFLMQLTPDYTKEIGIYYSLENLLLTSTFSFLDYSTSARNFLRIINGMGLNPIFVTRDSILSSPTLKVIILPSMIYLSDEEIELFKNFLKNGTIIADLPPACVTPEVIEKYQKNPELITLNSIQNLPSQLIQKPSYSHNIKEEVGGNCTSAENVKLLGYNMNLNLYNIPIPTLIKIISELSDTFNNCGIESKILPSNGWIDGRCFTFENYQYIAWLPNQDFLKIKESTDVNPRLYKGKKIYDFINKKHNKKIILESKMFPSFYSIYSDETIDYVKIEYPDNIAVGNRLPIKMSINTEKMLEKNKKNYFYLTIESDLTELKNTNKLYSKIIEIRNDYNVEISIPIPLNQPKGKYKINLKEFSSGKEKTFYFTVE